MRPLGRRHCWLAAGALALAASPTSAVPLPQLLSTPAPLAEPLSPLRLEINLPAYRLDAHLHGRQVASYPITAGARWEPTITGRFTIRQVEWNPWWHPPAHRRPKDKVTPPGPRNPMGRVKLPFHGIYFVHGTAREHEIGRAASRGCVRLRNDDAVALARLIHLHASPGLPPAEVDGLVANPRRTRTLKLDLPVEVVVTYRLVEVHEGRLAVYPDVYRQETRPLTELARAALDAAELSATRLGDELATALIALAREGGWIDLAATPSSIAPPAAASPATAPPPPPVAGGRGPAPGAAGRR
jgi:hypothetical protein